MDLLQDGTQEILERKTFMSSIFLKKLGHAFWKIHDGYICCLMKNNCVRFLIAALRCLAHGCGWW